MVLVSAIDLCTTEEAHVPNASLVGMVLCGSLWYQYQSCKREINEPNANLEDVVLVAVNEWYQGQLCKQCCLQVHLYLKWLFCINW